MAKVSIFVPKMTTRAALNFQEHMANKYGYPKSQHVITKQGVVDTTKGTATPINFDKTIFGHDAQAKPQHFIASGNGELLPFSFHPEGKELPVKEPYEGEHFSNVDHGKVVLGSRLGFEGAEKERAVGAPAGATFRDKGVPAPPDMAGMKHVKEFKGEKSVVDLSNPNAPGTAIWQKAWNLGIQDAQAKRLKDKAVTAHAANMAETAIQRAGYDGYRNPKLAHGWTKLFGDTPVTRPGETPEPPELTPHPQALKFAEEQRAKQQPLSATKSPQTGVASRRNPTKTPAKTSASQPTTQKAPVRSPQPSGAPTSSALPPNASGESAASQEAINRLASEKSGGITRVRIDTRSRQETPLIGPEAVDARPGPHDAIVTRDASGKETLLDKGEKARYNTPSSPVVQVKPHFRARPGSPVAVKKAVELVKKGIVR